MGKPDVYESDYLENAEIFADLINGVLYQGEQVVKPQALKEQDGELRLKRRFGIRSGCGMAIRSLRYSRWKIRQK